MNNIRSFPEDKAAESIERLAKLGVAKSGEPPYDGGMEARVAKLEEFAMDTRDRLVRIESRLDHIDKDMATKDGTKASIAEAKNSIIMWVVSAILLAQLLPALLKKFGL